eukprot:gene2089-2126_t
MAFFIHHGGRSSSAASITVLNSLNWWRTPGADQNATTVSKGGQPGWLHSTCATETTASSGSLKRSRVQPRSRSMASRVSRLRARDHTIAMALS